MFSVCARFGAIAAGAPEELERLCGDYGWNLGMAFQLTDDLLDFYATEEVLGKPVGNDLREGKVTLPLILALEGCPPEDRARVETVVADGGYERVSAAEIADILERRGSAKTVRRRAGEFISESTRLLSSLPDTPYRRALASIAEWVVDRRS